MTSGSESWPPKTFPDGEPFPGVSHLATLHRLLRVAQNSPAPARKHLMLMTIVLAEIVRNPRARNPTPHPFEEMLATSAWLENCNFYAGTLSLNAFIADLQRFGHQTGQLSTRPR